MLTLSVQFLFVINIQVKTISSQFYPNPYQSMPQPYQIPPPTYQFADYDIEPLYRRRSGRNKKYGFSGGALPIFEYGGSDSDECYCSCNRCSMPTPCCRETCISCPNSKGLVIIPFPYPLVVPPPPPVLIPVNFTTLRPVTKVTTTTAKSTWKLSLDNRHMNPYEDTFDEIDGDLEELLKKQNKDGRRYMLTSFRKTKPTLEANYGILPIPDTLAKKLMLQLRSAKEQQARRNRF